MLPSEGNRAQTHLARYVVEIPSIVRSDPDRHQAIDAVFDLLAGGWRGAPQR
jgi:hypothetical protein